MADASALLAAYDTQLRTAAEVQDARSVTRIGPLWAATFAGRRGFVTYAGLDGADPDALVAAAVAHFAGTDVTEVEWKTRGHDDAPGLQAALERHGFVADEAESVMLGEARLLDVDVPLPAGVRLRRLTGYDDLVAMKRLQDEVFGRAASGGPLPELSELLERLRNSEQTESWVAEADGRMVGAGRVDAVAGTEFAGIWGGATLPRWRGRGIYRALTAVRARSAMRLGKRLVHSDSTEFSRPILERAGLVKVTTTTPYLLRA